MTLYSSERGAWATDFRGYLGARGRRRVLGRWKETEVRTLRCEVPEVPLRAAFFAALALESAAGAAGKGRRKTCQRRGVGCVCVCVRKGEGEGGGESRKPNKSQK